MTDPKIIGRLIKATAPGRRTLRGVVLPSARRSRNGALRIAVDGKKPTKFDPEEWTITVLAGPVYGYGELPAEHLATRTMLRTELRREPAPGQKPAAEYRLRKGTAPLFAVVDTVPMKALSPARAEAWTEARTCERCGDVRPRPLVRWRDGARRCDKCQGAAALELWSEQCRVLQEETTQWARDVLADPKTLLLTRGGTHDVWLLRIETVAGELIADVRLRSIEDLDGWETTLAKTKTPEQLKTWRAKYDNTVTRSEFMLTAAGLQGSRMVAWCDRDSWIELASMPHVVPTDQVGDRLAIWSGEAPNRYGNWYPEPRIPWSYYPLQYEPHNEHRHLRGDVGLDREIRHLREVLRLMATQPAPTPHAPR